jgi:D-threo-aldose 1-dehydrogenase
MREPSRRVRQDLLAAAFDEGITHFDVARMYGLGAAEGELGRFVSGRRDQITVATKFGIQPSATPGLMARIQGPARRLIAHYPSLRRYVKQRSGSLYQPHRYDALSARVSLETSLREMQTEYVDLFLVHDPSPRDPIDVDDIGAYLEGARQAGHLRAWGVAGEQDPCFRIKEALPQRTILQVRDDAFARVPAPVFERGPVITFGVVAGALDRILAHVATSQRRRARWASATGVEFDSPDAVGSLLVQDALRANRDGVVLVSTTRPHRLRGLDALACAAEAGGDGLRRFRELLRAELLGSQSAVIASPAD